MRAAASGLTNSGACAAGRGLGFKPLSPMNLGITMGIAGGGVAMLNGSVNGYERPKVCCHPRAVRGVARDSALPADRVARLLSFPLQGFRDNGLPAIYPEFVKFRDAPRAPVETLHVRSVAGVWCVCVFPATLTAVRALRACAHLHQKLDKYRQQQQ